MIIPLVQTMRIGTPSKAARRSGHPAPAEAAPDSRSKVRVFIAAENRLLREALSRVLRQGNIEVAAAGSAAPLATGELQNASPQVLLLTSRGSLHEDLQAIRAARTSLPNLPILLIGTTGDVQEFLDCVRAGISGYLPRDASAQQVREAVQAIHAGEGVCPGPLCRALFDHVANTASASGTDLAGPSLRLTPREEQLVSLIAKGLSKKEIAYQLSLSESTVKNHVYRLKRKLAAKDRTTSLSSEPKPI